MRWSCQWEMGFVPADASRSPASARSSASVPRRCVASRRAAATSAQIFVPTSTSDWRNSGFTASPSRGSASAINVSMCARSRPSASTIWYSSSTPRVSQSPFTPARLAPELVESVRVLGEGPALRDLAVLEVEGVDGLRADALPVALGRARREDRPVLVVGDDGVPLELEGPATELHELAEEAEDLVLSPVVAGNLAPAGDVERHVLGEEPSERVQVTLLEGVVALVQQ